MQTTITIDASKQISFEKRIAQMQRKAERLGFEPITIVDISPEREREVTIDLSYGGGEWDTTCKLVREVDVTIEGALPVFNDWTVLCKIEHTEDGNIIHGDTEHMTTEQICNFQPLCHHCNQKRDRKATYILRHADGGLMQVGGSCLKDFTRSENPAAEFNYGVDLIAFLGGDDGLWQAQGGVDGTKIIDLIAVGIAIVERNGYINANTARYSGVPSTTQLVFDALKNRENKFCSTIDLDAYRTKAQEVIDWALAQEAETSYMSNCHVLLGNTMVSSKYAGYIVGLISAKRSAEARAIREAFEATAINEHVGQVKERLRNLNLTVQMIREFEGMYGVTTMLILRDERGRTFKWMASGFKNFEQGDTVVLDGTVKEHAEYNETKQTVLTRCKIQQS